MTTETLSPSAEQEDFFTPVDAEAFERFVHEDLADHLVEVPVDEVEKEKILWRGHDPHDVAGLLSGHKSDIALDHQYVTLHKDRAISYNRGGEDIHYNVAIGFMPPDEWQSRSVADDVPADLQKSDMIMKYQRGNFEASGHITPNNIRFIAIRPHGGPGKEPGPVKYYKLAA